MSDRADVRIVFREGWLVDPLEGPAPLLSRPMVMCLREQRLHSRGGLLSPAAAYWSTYSDKVFAPHLSLDDCIGEALPGVVSRAPELQVGEYYPRIWRPGDNPPLEATGLRDAWLAAVAASSGLFEQLRSVFRVLEPDSRNSAAFGHDLRQLLILACNEVEAGLKGILVANDHPKSQPGMNEYKLLEPATKLSDWALEISSYPGFGPLRPFVGWKDGGSLPWYADHQAVKHDRERELHRASLTNVISAVAGVCAVLIAQFGIDVLDYLAVPPLARFRVVGTPKWEPWRIYLKPFPDDVPKTEWKPRFLELGISKAPR